MYFRRIHKDKLLNYHHTLNLPGSSIIHLCQLINHKAVLPSTVMILIESVPGTCDVSSGMIKVSFCFPPQGKGNINKNKQLEGEWTAIIKS